MYAALGSWPGASTATPTIVMPYSRAKYGKASWNVTSFRFASGIVAIRARIDASSASSRVW